MFVFMYYGGLLLGIAGLAASIAAGIKLDIYHVFLEVSGLEAKRAVKKRKEQRTAKERKSGGAWKLQATELLEETAARIWVIDEEYMEVHTEERAWKKEERR